MHVLQGRCNENTSFYPFILIGTFCGAAPTVMSASGNRFCHRREVQHLKWRPTQLFGQLQSTKGHRRPRGRGRRKKMMMWDKAIMEEVKGTLIVSLFMISHCQVLLINRSKRKFRSCNWLEAFFHLASLWTLLWLNKCQVMPWQIKLGTRSWSSLNVKKHNDELFIRRGLHNRQLCGVNTKQELQHSGHFEQFTVFYTVKMVNKKLIKPLDQEGDLPDCEAND